MANTAKSRHLFRGPKDGPCRLCGRKYLFPDGEHTHRDSLDQRVEQIMHENSDQPGFDRESALAAIDSMAIEEAEGDSD